MKVGILGLGSIGTRHAENAMALGHGMRGYDSRNGSAADRLEVIEWADKIVIASPTDQHIYDIIDCIKYKKPILVEKPLAHAWSGCLLSEYVRMVGYNLRFHSIVQEMKDAIDDGKIGTPIWANFTLGQLSAKSNYLRDGVILNWSHEIDLALHLLGPAEFVAANVHRTDTKDDVADILLTHRSGCRTTVHLDYVSNPWIRVGTIVGDKGQLYYDLENSVLDLCGAVQLFSHDEFDKSYKREMSAFLSGISSLGCTAAEAGQVLDICLKARVA